MEPTNYFIWNVNPVMFAIGSIQVRWYGVLFATGLAIGYYLLKKVFRQENKNPELVETLLLYFIAGTVLGARLGHVFFYDWPYYSQNPWEIIKIYRGGLASHGAIVGIIFTSWLFIHFHFKKHFVWLLDRLAVFIPLGGAFIRIGNFFNSEILGYKTDVAWAVIFTHIDNIPRHPAQLYEALAYLVIFAIMLYLLYKTKAAKQALALTGWFFSLIFGFRFFVEFFKEEQSDLLTSDAMLNMGQWLSIPVVIIGLSFIVLASMHKTKHLLPTEQMQENNQTDIL